MKVYTLQEAADQIGKSYQRIYYAVVLTRKCDSVTAGKRVFLTADQLATLKTHFQLVEDGITEGSK